MKNQRLAVLEKLMKQRKLDAVLLSTFSDTDYNDNIYYYTGFKGYGLLLCRKQPFSATLIVSPLEIEKAQATGAGTALVTRETKEKILKNLFKNSKITGIDKRTMTLSQFDEIKKCSKHPKFKDISRELSEIRSIKDKDEIQYIKTACEACDKIFSEITDDFQFSTEKELSDFIELRIKEKGHDISFKPIVSSGKNASDIHHRPTGKINEGFMILDFGCKVEGYCSDMTRTIFVGTPTSKEKQLYQNLLEVQQNAVKNAVIGTRCSSLHKSVKDTLGNEFLHGLGHGVGLEIHELPILSKESIHKLCENMVITIEPGIYKKGKYGIRIEDTVLISKYGPVYLTSSKRELITVKKTQK